MADYLIFEGYQSLITNQLSVLIREKENFPTGCIFKAAPGHFSDGRRRVNAFKFGSCFRSVGRPGSTLAGSGPDCAHSHVFGLQSAIERMAQGARVARKDAFGARAGQRLE